MSFGFMDFGNTFQIGESALNQDQYIKALFFEQFTNQYNATFTDELVNKVKEMGLSENDLLAFKKVSDKTQNNTECYLPDFISALPLNCARDENLYDGNFSSNDGIIIERNLNRASFFEIFHKEWIGYEAPKSGFSLFKKKPKYEPVANVPEWLQPETNKQELFETYIGKKEYDKAWLTINGPGFTPREVGNGLQQLKSYTNDEAYHLWADFWCNRYGDMDSFIFI